MTVAQLIIEARRQHEAFRFSEAESTYRLILAQQPDHADALHGIGTVSMKMRRYEAALDFFRRAVARRPDSAEFQSSLALVLAALRRNDDAITAFRKSLTQNPADARSWYNLGVALKSIGKSDEALDAYRRAISLQDDLAAAHLNLGNLLHERGQYEEALASHRRAADISPDLAAAHNNLGNSLLALGRMDEAAAALKKAAELQPDFPEPHYNLGKTLQTLGRTQAAIDAFRHAIKIDPNFPEAHKELGTIFRQTGQTDEAIESFRRALSLRPDDAQTAENLAGVLAESNRHEEAIAAYRNALVADPRRAQSHANLGVALWSAARTDEAVACFNRALELAPGDAAIHSRRIYAMYFHPGETAASILTAQKEWNHRHAQPLKSTLRPHQTDAQIQRPLRIGYVSPDFRSCAVGRHFLPVLREHDRQHFEIFCYNNAPKPNAIDPLTTVFQATSNWRNIADLHDSAAERLIRADGIDILVDLSQHGPGNRLPLFARKPAPVQLTAFTYPAGTGAETIDFRLTDPHLDPANSSDEFYTEKSGRLPSAFCCYDPAAMELAWLPDVAPPPALTSGHVTFGCLNNFCKINAAVLELWAKVLIAVKNSGLLMLAPAEARPRVLSRLAENGIEASRIDFTGRKDRLEYFQSYRRIDIALDTFPFNGHTTSLDALWMGVPLVTLVGATSVGRMGLSHLSNLNLRELAAETPGDFIRIASNLASDLPKLSQLRTELRDRMKNSPLTDAAAFTRTIEAAYQQIWQQVRP